MKIYVSGPMTGHPELNFPAFHRAAADLREQGHEVVNPAEIDHGIDPDWETCLRNDISQLVTCDAIMLLPGFATSRGATLERHIALELSMTVMYAPEVQHESY